MKTYQKLERFPLGAIRAEGFLREQMLRGKDAMAGHLFELEPEMIAAPYVQPFQVPVWSATEALGWGAEISGNYWTGYIQYAFTLQDEQMIRRATQWVEQVLSRQLDNGYLGTYQENGHTVHEFEDYNAWGTASGLRGLIAFYEATGRTDVLNAVHKCLLWFCTHWAGDKKTVYAGPLLMEPMVFVYHLTADQRLIDFCQDYMAYLCRNDLFSSSYKSMLEEPLYYNANHTAGMGITTRLPALVYTATGNPAYLKASQKRLEDIREMAVQVSGSPVSMAEFLGPVSATAETEYCSYAFFNATYSYMSYITGQSKYGDYMEELFYNGAQGARKKDERAIAYLNAPNQVYATTTSSNGMGDMQVYAPCYPTACCPVNAVAVVPEFIRGMMLRDDNGNVYIMAYGPCSVHDQGLSLEQQTQYPFRNTVTIRLNCEKTFSIYLREPQWSEGTGILVNGTPVCAKKTEEGFFCVRRDWQPGDLVEITFQASVQVLTVNDRDAGGKYPLAIKYGALVFAYHVPEQWEPIPGRPMTPLPAGWSWYDVNPKFSQPNIPDIHERNGALKHTFSWNVALDARLCNKDFQVEYREDTGYVWEDPPIRLHTQCYKAPYLWAPYQTKTFESFGPYQPVTEALPLVLEPYGCTNLRITYFPKADSNCMK